MLRAFGRNESGGVTITFAMMSLVLITGSGVAMDYSYAAFQRARLQQAADSAALAGAGFEGSKEEIEATARRLFQANDQTGVTPNVVVDADKVTVTASYLQPTFIMHGLGHAHTAVGVRAIAGRGRPEPACVITLEKVEKESLFLNSASKLNTDCGVQVNSSASEALRMNSGSSINAEQICVKGGWTSGGSNVYQPAPKKCPEFADPLAELPAPVEASAACTKSDHKIDKVSATLSPGVYCKNLTIDNGAVVTLSPGIYVIREGILKINSGSKLIRKGVMLFFIGKDARLQMDSSSKLEISAPTSGTYADIVIFQDRNTSTDSFMINSHGSSMLEGVVYIPSSNLKLNSDSGATSNYLQIIVRRLELNSLGSIVIKNKKHLPKQAALRAKPVSLIQ